MTKQNIRKESTDQSMTHFYDELISNDFFVFENDEMYFQETLLQIAWNEQLLTGPLLLEDGRQLRIVHQGIWNLEAGPDFKDGSIFIDEEMYRGPIEIHKRAEHWKQHNHHHDHAYDGVILHVVWDNSAGYETYPLGTPLFSLKKHLSIGLDELIATFSPVEYPYARQVKPTSIAAYFAKLQDAPLQNLFQSYGLARVLERAREYGELIQKNGLNQTAYERLFDALGYKNNRDGFREITQMAPLDKLVGRDHETSIAILFGIAGMLPDPIQIPVLHEYKDWVAKMWADWWSHREEYRFIKWNRRGRPFNAPERRLLAGAEILRRTEFNPGSKIVSCFIESADGKEALSKLRSLFLVEDTHWNDFYNFEKKLSKGGTLLGDSRVDDMLVNVAIPIFFSWCFVYNKPEECIKGRDAFLLVKKLQDNRRFKEAVSQFFIPPARSSQVIKNACGQQGLLKLHVDYQETR